MYERSSVSPSSSALDIITLFYFNCFNTYVVDSHCGSFPFKKEHCLHKTGSWVGYMLSLSYFPWCIFKQAHQPICWRILKCPPTDEQIKEYVVYTYSGILYILHITAEKHNSRG